MLSSHCFENPPNLSSTCGAGRVEELAGLKTYVTGPLDSKRAVLFIADAFGYEAPKLRKLADKVASAGFLVVVPDFYYGDPVIDANDPKFNREAWLKAHSPDKGYQDAKPVIAALKSKGVSAIVAAGFCWGGMVLVKLAGTEDIQAAVILHPGHMTEDEIKDLVLGTGGFADKYDVLVKKFMNSVTESANATNSDEEIHYASAVKIPTAILGAENDHIFSAAEMKKLGEIMSAKTEIESYVKIFPGVGHGWSVRYNEGDEFAVKSAGEAQEDMLNWFLKHVK